MFLACLPGLRKSLSPKFFPFHSVLTPVCWSLGDLIMISDRVWALSLGLEPIRFPTSCEVSRLCSLLFHRLGCLGDKFAICIVHSWRFFSPLFFFKKTAADFDLADFLATSHRELGGVG